MGVLGRERGAVSAGPGATVGRTGPDTAFGLRGAGVLGAAVRSPDFCRVVSPSLCYSIFKGPQY